MKLFDGQVVLITGAARGLGRDYANFFARDGAIVALADLNAPDEAADAIRVEGGRAISIAADVTNPDSMAAAIERIDTELGRLDILINNAGLWRRLHDYGLLECPLDAWTAAWSVNITGSLIPYQFVVPIMQRQQRGRIINISSMSSATGANAYGLTKAAVEHMTEGMAREVGKFGITVNCIAPGITAFEGAKAAIPQMQALVEKNAVPRMGRSRDLYDALRYLCSDDASWVTGETLRVDGGALV